MADFEYCGWPEALRPPTPCVQQARMTEANAPHQKASFSKLRSGSKLDDPIRQTELLAKHRNPHICIFLDLPFLDLDFPKIAIIKNPVCKALVSSFLISAC